ncbi:hypothetical protein HAL_03850 [Haladaptatus sp. T7]|nr:hypothetical protein HAL_03850 [Haladaptatus sp. T7]
MEVAIVSDMHVPGQAERIPDAFREHIRTVDHVIHAGDFGSEDALVDVQALASDLTAFTETRIPTTSTFRVSRRWTSRA